MIGLEIEVKSLDSNILLSIIGDIIYKDFIFSVPYKEFVYKTYIDQDENYIVAGDLLKKELEENNLCFICQLNLQAYKAGNDISKIDNYDDFIKSKCQFIILITDARFIEIYIKDNMVGKQIIENIEKKNLKYHIKTKDNDGRTNMNLF